MEVARRANAQLTPDMVKSVRRSLHRATREITVPKNAEHLDWALPDPVGAGDQIRFQLEAFRDTRDEITQRLESFWKDKAS